MSGSGGERSGWVTVAAVLGAIAALVSAIVGVTQLTGGKDKSTSDTKSVTTTSSSAVQEGIYAGTAGSNPGLTFTVNGSEVSDIQATLTVSCTNRQTGQVSTAAQTFRSFPQTRGTISADGSFAIDVHLQSQVFRMSGTFQHGEVSGTMSWTGARDALGRPTSSDAALFDCVTGELEWSAHV
jgi:hypothetical protein